MFLSMLLLLRLCATDCNVALAVEIHDQIEKNLALLPGPLFKCDMLVDGSCNIDCDWETMKKLHCFTDDEKMVAQRWLFIVSVDDEGQVLPAQACHASRIAIGCRNVDPSVCTLQACGKQFPAKQKRGGRLQPKLLVALCGKFRTFVSCTTCSFAELMIAKTQKRQICC